MTTTRRAFLLGVAATGVAITAPVKAAARYVHALTRPRPRELGNGITHWTLWNDLTPEERNILLSKLHADAARNLPSGSRYQLRLSFPTDFGRAQSVGWYHSEFMQDAHRYERASGYNFMLGKFVTP